MKSILFTGRGTSGSWQIRGVQLGAAVGGAVVPVAAQKDIDEADLVVLVKRPTEELQERLKRLRVPLVWDVVDAWPGHVGNTWDRFACMCWLETQIRTLNPAAVVAATKAMAADVGELFPKLPVLYLPHHYRPSPRQFVVRDRIYKVGYEGSPRYYGEWCSWVQSWCDRNSADFLDSLSGPDDLLSVDVVLALRNHDGYAPRLWKSNVKLANAQGAGVPIVCGLEAGYLETMTPGTVMLARTRLELVGALDLMKSAEVRGGMSLGLREAAGRYALPVIAERYRGWLEDIAG